MAKLFRIRWFYILLLTSVYLLSAPPVLTVDTGSIFLDNKEQEVKQIAAAALENHKKCVLVSSCEQDCSRATCAPLREEKVTCARVNNNTECSASDGNTCKDMMLNYDRSYVTLPKGANAEKLQAEVRRDICLQRGLDPTYRAIYNRTQYSYMYYGTTSGAWRAYPGRESSENFCTSFECRQRPWYLDGISVRKQVRILIDTGTSMGAPVNGEYSRDGATYLQIAINLSLAIIQTLSPQDYVEVISFNSTGAYSLVTSPVLVGNYNQSVDGNVLNPELEPLKSSVRSLFASQGPANSDLTAAVVEGISTLWNTTPRSLKLVVIITDGNFLPLNGTTFPTAAILAHQAKLLMYRLPYNAGDDPYLDNTTLPTLLCQGVQGSFEVLDAPSTVNPLYAIRSYFSYLAQVHMIAAESKPLWSNVYTSIAEALNATTVTYPAIDSNGELIGVAAIDVFLNELDSNLQEEVLNDFVKRKRGTLPAPDVIPLNCTTGKTVPHVCSTTVPVPTEGIICQKTDQRTMQERVCCKSCFGPAPSPSSSHSSKWKIAVGAGAAVGAVVFLLVAAAVIVGLLKKRARPRGVHHSKPDSPINCPPP